ncbi:MAG TPA: hypothetical protein VHW66_21905 [Stellaceae bacterium]|jgi:hypothetical protein|nr:hypothetical protein [Stellaceae bacterium]
MADTGATDDLAILFDEAVDNAACWWEARAHTTLMRNGQTIEGVACRVVNLGGQMDEGITCSLTKLARNLNVPVPKTSSYSDGARCLLGIHRQLQKDFPTPP